MVDKIHKKLKNVDWVNMTDAMITDKLGMNVSVIRKYRLDNNLPQCRFKFLNESTVKQLLKLEKLNKEKISQMTRSDIAKSLKITPVKVDYILNIIGYKCIPDENKIRQITWDHESVDWANMTDAMIAEKMNLSRERIRQVRKKFNYPKSKIKGQRAEHIKFIQNIKQKLKSLGKEKVHESHMPTLMSILQDEIKNIKRITQKRKLLKKILNETGWKCRSGKALNRKCPWNLLDWRLPNKILSDIWNIPKQSIASRRYEFSKPYPIWDGRQSLNIDQLKEMQSIVDSQKESKEQWIKDGSKLNY